MRNRFYYLLIFLLFVVGIARAAIVSNLNVAAVSVANMSISARQQVVPKALGQVLIKISGNPTIMTLPVIQNALDSADTLIQSYGYNRQAQQDGQSQLMLQVTFDKKALKQLLRQAGQPDWSQDRPLVLLWCQTQAASGGQMLSNTSDPVLAKNIQNMAKTRGVPIVFPAMDLQDQSFVKENSNTFDSSLLQEAAARYGAVAILAGNIQQDGNQWQGQWLLLMNDTPFRWSNKADSVAALYQSTVNDMVNLMANQLAVVDEKDLQTKVVLDISNVVGLNDYAQVLTALRHMKQVAGVSVVDMDGSDLLLQVKAIGGVQTLSDALSKQSHFIVIENSGGVNSKADLFYRWASDGSAINNDKNTQEQDNE